MPADTEIIKRFISALMVAISNCSLYSKDHTSMDDLAQKALSVLNELLEETDILEIMAVEDDLIVNKTPLRDAGTHGAGLIKRLRKKGVSRVDFMKGITFQEIKQFISDFSESDRETTALPHIKTGVIDVRLKGLKMDTDLNMDAISSLTSEQIDRIKDIYHDISPYHKLNIAGLEEIVVNFILTFRREANILKLISPVKTFSEYTYTHATNVAVLTMFQAESLGANDELLYDIGISALLHDVGKLFISKDILDKKGSLDDREWEEIRRHAIYGSKYLAMINGLTRIAPIVAFEHHQRYDGLGYPRPILLKEKQHLVSQIVAISDFFDALRSRRPYKRDLEIKEILVLMKKNSGREFNPFLVDNFLRIMMMALK
jgi:HD-GYP domain-containing protein (c-di-GMP phosphodiesterase class II)